MPDSLDSPVLRTALRKPSSQSSCACHQRRQRTDRRGELPDVRPTAGTIASLTSWLAANRLAQQTSLSRRICSVTSAPNATPRRGFDAAFRASRESRQGREEFSFLPGDVPPELDPAIADETLAAAGRLIRRFHDATTGTEIAAVYEDVCHNDLFALYFVFRESKPVGIIHFDDAAPGGRLRMSATPPSSGSTSAPNGRDFTSA